MDDLVIGSGPAGVSVATALLARGRKVTLLDGGKTLPPDAESRRAALAARDPAGWTAADREGWQRPQFDSRSEVSRFGSGHAIEPEASTFAASGGLGLRASRAVGGLSNYWGSAVLPYRQADMAGWPVSAADLAPHYRAVATFMPVAGRPDRLDPLFPAFPMAGRTPVPPGPQAEAVLARARDLADFHIGLARQAVAPGCRQCGQCLHGCPWRLIWSAADQLAVLRYDAGLTYRPGDVVRGFTEDADGVTVTLDDGRTLRGARLFVAAGVLESARILLASGHGGGVLTLQDSAQAFLPLIQRSRPARPPDAPPFHTLPQMFAELTDESVSPHTVHAQIYGWNEYYARDLIQNYGRRLPGSAPLWRALARRLIVAQVFLHSDHSARADLRLAADGRLSATLTPSPETPAVMSRAARRLSRDFGALGLTALRFALRPGAPGSSFHAGATVPMAAAPVAGQSDILGRPQGLARVHLADASCLPAIPATTITFAVMANAHRIGTLAP